MTDKMLARKDGAIATMTFNNPERHNAVSFEMWDRAAEILADFKADPAVRVVVITGAGGKAFVSGADISKFGDERATSEAQAKYNATTEKVYAGLHAFPKPTIAMIRGFCIGGGLGVAMACDVRFSNTTAKFGLPAAKLGLGYGYNGLKRFIDAIGPMATRDIFFTGRQFDAAEAEKLGVISRSLPDADLESHVMAYAQSIADNAPLTVSAIKFITTEVLKADGERDLAACQQRVAACFASRDYVEGRTAFLEKRKPRFEGR